MAEIDLVDVTQSLDDFGYSLGSDSSISGRIIKMATLYNLTEEEIADNIIAFLNKHKRTVLSYENLEQLDLELGKQKKVTREKENVPKEYNYVDIGEKVAEIPSKDKQLLSGKYAEFCPIRMEYMDIEYHTRNGKGSIVSNLKGECFKVGNFSGKAEVELMSIMPGNFFANEKCANIIDKKYEKMRIFSELFIKENKDITYWTKELTSSNQETFIYGEIIREGTDIFNDGLIQLQCDNEKGTIVPVNINDVPDVTIFPGQIAAFVGCNESGHIFNAKRQLNLPKFEQYQQEVSNIEHLKIWVAAGPFSKVDSLGYEALCDFLGHVRKEEPHVLILMGPFVERKSKKFMDPDFEMTKKDVMDNLMINIAKALKGKRTEVVLQQSAAKDVSSFGSFPAAPLLLKPEAYKQFNERIHLVPDPAIIRIAGISVALTTSEIVSHLSKHEYHKAETVSPTDRIARLSSHLLSQRSLYPLNPPGLPLRLYDTLKSAEMNRAPHLLLIPSMLPPSAKLVDETLVCNPGGLRRGKDGTFLTADINLRLAKESSFTKAGHFQVVRI